MASPGDRAENPRVSLLVDARGLYSSGIGRYLREVLKVILRDPRFGEITLAGSTADVRRFAGEVNAGARIRTAEYAGAYYSPRAQWEWAARVSRIAADVTFFPHYDVPLVAMPERSVVTVHDLIHYKVPRLFAWWRRAAGAVLLGRAVGGARRVIVVSQSTANDVVERYPEAASRVTVIHHGVPEGFAPVTAAEAEAERRSMGGRFLLCVGNRKPHKNLKSVVESFAWVREAYPDLKFVLAGRADEGWSEVEARARELGVLNAIVDPGEVSDGRLRSLYGAAEALVFPSLYEGFGLPLLEAMACGCPVVASNSSSIPEVVGDAGLLNDPLDVAGFTDDIRMILSDGQLRKDLVERSLRRAELFSLETAGRRTADMLYEASGRQVPTPVAAVR